MEGSAVPATAQKYIENLLSTGVGCPVCFDDFVLNSQGYNLVLVYEMLLHQFTKTVRLSRDYSS